MKQKDYILIGATAVFSAVMSFVISGIFISPPDQRSQTAEVVEVITDQFTPTASQYFNENSVNPTQLIQISPNQPEGNVPFGSE